MLKRGASSAELFIVIPVYNGWAQTRQCLYALRESTYQDFRIIVVAHGSTDESKSTLLMEFPEVECLLGDTSLWWTGATNLGIEHAMAKGASYVMLLNNDCYMTPDAIGKLRAYSERCGDNCIVAPVTKDMLTDKVLNLGFTTCILLGFPSIRLPSIGLHKHQQMNELAPARLIMGGRGVIIPTPIFQRVGLLDEINLPHYLSDHDFYLRCKKAGIQLMHAMDAQLVVDNTRTTIATLHANMAFSTFRETLSNKRSHRNLKDLKAFFKKHYPIPGLYRLGVCMNLTRYILLYVWVTILRKCCIFSHK